MSLLLMNLKSHVFGHLLRFAANVRLFLLLLPDLDDVDAER